MVDTNEARPPDQQLMLTVSYEAHIVKWVVRFLNELDKSGSLICSEIYSTVWRAWSRSRSASGIFPRRLASPAISARICQTSIRKPISSTAPRAVCIVSYASCKRSPRSSKLAFNDRASGKKKRPRL